ncbi:uncharacterized protein H6S33_005261 [Morchella sextelata]|uniref:uncharacterized protein n=1 Tax=Morchella sextelata TaxID=1174677 RepID=UPI001D0540E6|nr:uncharacterized protein H6S33_005261 [Morchella sextelata]KAH0605279.1 hypothetical protein H6S33_005261 [Morchella sextelata]
MARHNHTPVSTVDTDLPLPPPKDNVGKTKLAMPVVREPRVATWLRRTVNKLGYWQLSVLVLGNIAILFAVAILCYLWSSVSRKSAEGTSVWEMIVFSGWILRVITLTSIIIRTAMTMQATVFCMVLASITLQRGGVLMQNAAAVSIYRFTNSGPHNMILPLFFAQRGWKSDVAMTMTALLSLTTVCSQFTSTILLMDLGQARIQTPTRKFDVAYGANENQSMSTGEFYVSSYTSTWTERPSNLPVFAEKTSENIVLHNRDNDGALYATGSTIRAFLPLEKKDRDALAEYKGPAAIMDSRVFCMSPYVRELKYNEAGYSMVNERGDNYSYPFIEATVGIDTFLEHQDELLSKGFLTSGVDNPARDIKFYCKTPLLLSYPPPFYEWPLSLCSPVYPGLQSLNSSGERTFNDTFQYTWVVLNMTGYDWLWANSTVNVENSTIDLKSGYGDSVDGEWTKFSFPSPDVETAESLDMSLSLCFSAVTSRNALVTARASWNLTEPTLIKDADKVRYNSTLIRKFLGVETGTKDDLDHESRQIADLVNIDDDDSSLLVTDNWITPSLVDASLSQYNFAAAAAIMCIWCQLDVSVHEGYINIFENTLRETSHPALAIQALLTSRALQIYEGRRTDLTTPGTALLNVIEPFQIPIRISGLSAILALIAFHMLLMIYVIVLFFKIEGPTSLGQSWQAVAQLEGEETIETMAFAKKATDVEVESWLTEKGTHRERMVIKKGTVMRKSLGSTGSYEYSRAPHSDSMT